MRDVALMSIKTGKKIPEGPSAHAACYKAPEVKEKELVYPKVFVF